MKSKKGFTLLEIIVVVGITIVISGVGIACIGDSIKRAKANQKQYEVKSGVVFDAQKNVHDILLERDAKLPPLLTVTPAPAGNNHGNNGENGNHYGNGGNNGNGNGNGDVNGNGNNGVNGNPDADKDPHANNENKHPDADAADKHDVDDTNTGVDNSSDNNNDANVDNNNDNSNNSNDNNSDNSNNVDSINRDNDANNGNSNGHGWGQNTDNGHGQASKQGTITLKANNQYDIQTNTTVKSTGNRGIETLVIKAPDGVSFVGVGDAGNGGRYDCKVDGNTITIQVKHDSWVTPATELNVNNVRWNGPQKFDITYEIVYAN